MRLKNKKWAVPFLSLHPETVAPIEGLKNKLQEWLSNQSHVFLEIGSGKGDFLITLGTNNQDKYFIGIERALTAVAIAGKKLSEKPLSNVFFSWIDFAILAPELPNHCFDGIFLNFSDPWPKKRHEKRRLTSDWFLMEYRRLLVPNGLLTIKTDNEELFEFTKKNLEKNHYNIKLADTNSGLINEFDAQSEYETHFRKLGKPIFRIITTPGEEIYAK